MGMGVLLLWRVRVWFEVFVMAARILEQISNMSIERTEGAGLMLKLPMLHLLSRGK